MKIIGQREPTKKPTKKRERSKTERIDRAIDLSLLGDDVDALISRLNAAEQTLFWEEIDRIRDGGSDTEKRDLWKIDYEREPPSMLEFLEDGYWLGGLTKKSEDSEGVFPKWKEILVRDWDLDSRVNNAVFTGSLGTGKCHGAGTRLIMADGTFKNVEEIQAGDRLMGDDSTPRKVLSTTRGRGPMFKVTPFRPKNSPSWTCNDAHILCLKGVKGDVIEVSMADYLANRRQYATYKLYRMPIHFPAPRSLHTRRTIGKTGFKVEPLGEGDYYGFTLDGNNRYLLEDTTVTHNTWNAMIVLAYRIVLARLLRNPAAFLGLSKGSMIFYVVLSISRSVVEETAFGDLKNFMANCPFFTEVCRYDPDRLYSNLRIPIGKNIIVTGGSRGQHIIGRNAMGCAMDEGNFRLEANPDTKAYELYDEIRNRLKNRFSRISGFLPAVSLLSSSARDQSSFTERVIDEINKNPNDNTQKIYSYAVYEIKPNLKLSDRYFKVAYGLRNVDPSVLQGAYDVNGKQISEQAEEPPKGSTTKLVPEDYIDEFRRNLRTALQSITGISTGSNYRLFGSSVDIERAIAKAGAVGLTNPCRVESISLSDEDKSSLWDYLDHKKILTLHHSEITPLRDRTMPRCIHIDLAKTSQAGFAVSHIVGKQVVEGKYNIMTGETFEKYDYVVEFDFIFSIVAGKHKPISTRKILAFVYWLRDVAHFPIALVTADQYNSLFPLQLLESNGFKIAQLSVDRSKKPYYDFRNGIEENRVRMFRHNILVNELENLVDTDKIDHPGGGTKDVADACCGSYFNTINMAGKIGSDPGAGLNPTFYTSMSTGESDEPPPVTINVDIPRRKIMTFEA